MIFHSGGAKIARRVAAVSVLAIALRMGLTAIALDEEPRYLAPDSIMYKALAKSLADGDGFALQGSPTHYRAPGYPAILGLAIGLFGQRAEATVLLSQAVCIVIPIGALSWLLSWIRREQPGAPIVAAALLALDPANLAYSTMLLSDAWFSSVSGLVVAFGVASLYRGTWWLSFLAGISSGVAALVHPSATYLWAACAFVHIGASGRPWRRRVVLALLVFAGHAMVLTPWIVRNYRLFGDPSLTKIRDAGLELKAAIVESYALGDSAQGLFGFLNGSLPDSEVMRLFRERHVADEVAVHTQLLGVACQYPGATITVGLTSVGVLYLDPCHGTLLRVLGKPGTGLFSGPSRGWLEAVRARPLSVAVTVFGVTWMVMFWASVALGIRRWVGQMSLLAAFCLVYCGYYTAVFSVGSLSAGGRYRLAMLPALVLLATPAFAGIRGQHRTRS